MSEPVIRPAAPQSVTRVIRILEALCASSQPLSLAELSRILDTPKSSMASLLRGLAEAEFVTGQDGTWRLGPGAFGLGSALLEARRRNQSPDCIREGMRKLAEQLNETVLFGVRDSDHLTYVDAVESRNAMRFSIAIGDRRPLYCTAGGRLLLAMDTPAEVARYLARLKPKPATPSTETDKKKLAQAIETARATGFAQTVDQAADGVTGTAAAIRGATGTVIGALIVAAPSSRLKDGAELLARTVRAEAENISRNLGHRTLP